MRDLKSITEEAFKHHRDGNLDIAEAMYDQMLSQLPNLDANILYGYGSLLVQKEKFGIGVALLQTALTVCDTHPGIWTNLAVAYKYTGRDDLAISAYEKAYALEPAGVEVLAGLSGYYINRNQSAKAEELARKALAIADHPAAHMHLALALLEQQRFEEAWPHYENRWNTHENLKNRRGYKSPKWDGSHINKLVIHGEQGLGDEIMFMSLFSKAKERAHEIVVECAERLIPVFIDSFGVRCYATEAELRDNESVEDAYIAMGSLPLVLGLPDGKPFLRRPKVTNVGKPIIGIAWKGGTLRTNHKIRSLNLKDFQPILDAVDAQFVSVQYGGYEVDEEAKKFGLVTGPRDLVSLQHRLGICDEIITVCQTAVHQAGAMGVPCTVLTPYKTAWRYCGEDSMLPWYSSVGLMRQAENEEWTSVVERVANVLRRQYAIAA